MWKNHKVVDYLGHATKIFGFESFQIQGKERVDKDISQHKRKLWVLHLAEDQLNNIMHLVTL